MTGLGFCYINANTYLEYAMESLIVLVGVLLYLEFFAHFVVTLYDRNKRRIENMEKLE